MSALTFAEGLPRAAHLTDPNKMLDDPQFHAQKPYRNGIVVYTDSAWLGNGFGTHTTKVAVRGTEIVAVYQTSGYYHRTAHVLGVVGPIYADTAHTGVGEYRRQYTTKTALSKWIEAVKALPSEGGCGQPRAKHDLDGESADCDGFIADK